MRRGSGILLHITSLPSEFGIGDFGPSAYRFVDFLAESGQSYWQMLPLNPTDPVHGNCPYSSVSAFAKNPLLISPELLVRDGFLTTNEIKPKPPLPNSVCDYSAVIEYKRQLLEKLYEKKNDFINSKEVSIFRENNPWVEDYALFISLKRHFNEASWDQWQLEIRDRQSSALEVGFLNHKEAIEREIFVQYLLDRQWRALKKYCNEKGIQIIGDLPIYVNHDSADVWCNPYIFKLDSNKRPLYVSGVPPDRFSATGQLWGSPVYDWQALKADGFKWWLKRMEMTLSLFDVVRIDHFRGLVAYWEIGAWEKTAINGRWVEVPVVDFLNALKKRFFYLPIIAEDLGLITADVREVMRRFNLPGMKVLLFAFGEDHPMHPYLPHVYDKNCIVYTGTHDNNTARGWFEREATEADKKRLWDYLGKKVGAEEVSWELIRLAMISVADMAVFPLQDLLSLGEEARLNTPSKPKGNWEWRVEEKMLTPELAQRLKQLTYTYGRL